MKEESSNILDELIMEHSKRMERPDGLSNEMYERIDTYNNHEDKICEFLKSIPKIESRLCSGGYIQDKNGTPCCDGDKVRFQYAFEEEIYTGTLTFQNLYKCFAIVYGEVFFFWINSGIKWFEKVE